MVAARPRREIAHRHEPSAVVLVHTDVDPAFEGQGLGPRLVAGALTDLRRRGLRVVWLCAFVTGYLRRHLAHQDIVIRET